MSNKLRLSGCVLSTWKRNVRLSIRLCSNLTSSKASRHLNPFVKKIRHGIKIEDESRIANRICITVLGNGGFGQPRCIGLFTNFKSYFFNCGEGVGRLCREYDITMHYIRHVFVTQKKWENISGLADILVSNSIYGTRFMCLYGPPKVEDFLSVFRAEINDLVITKKEENFIDHTLSINHIPILRQGEKIRNPACNKKQSSVKGNSDVVYCYICKIFERPGEFSVEKCIEHGVPAGPLLLKLKNWENVVLPSGKSVYAEDVHEPSCPGTTILIVDCPDEYFLDSFITKEEFKKYMSISPSSDVSMIFHFTPTKIFTSAKYQDWIKRFHEDVQHYVLNSDNPNTSSIIAHQIQKYFNLMHPEIFRKLKAKKELSMQTSTNINVMHPPPMLQIHLRPKKEVSWSNVVNHENPDDDRIGLNLPEFFEKLKDLRSDLIERTLSNDIKEIYPEVEFFGTSSATSTAYRNVTSILLNTSPQHSILLDCGEGTMNQFIKYYGSDVYRVLKKISCIFISHRHTDHYLGLYQLLLERKKAFEIFNLPYKPVLLILPYVVQDLFKKFCRNFEDLFYSVKIISCKNLPKVRYERLKPYLHNIQVLTVPVVHCPDSYGVILQLNSKWKVVYSGDTAPCVKLVEAGKNCTLLIHEASIEDDFVSEAVAKKHSTPSQVIDIAKKMNAQYTIMTHFSKRYLASPIIPEYNSVHFACAYDFMKVRMRDLPLLPFFTPAIKSLFQEHHINNLEKSSFVVNFENVFLKTLRS